MRKAKEIQNAHRSGVFSKKHCKIVFCLLFTLLMLIALRTSFSAGSSGKLFAMESNAVMNVQWESVAQEGGGALNTGFPSLQMPAILYVFI